MNTNAVISMLSLVLSGANKLIADELTKRSVTDIVTSHGDILINLYKHKVLSMSQLSSLIHKKKNTVTVLVKKLQEAGYINLTKSLDDGRITYVELTNKGRKFHQHFQDISEIVLEKFWGDIPSSEQQQFLQLLSRINDNIQE